MTDAGPAATDPFSPAVIEAITRHMNIDHAADSLLICRTLGGQPEATAVTMTGLDPCGVTFLVERPGGPVTTSVAWSEPITERAQVRAEVVRMFHEACAAAGIAVEAHQTHNDTTERKHQ